MNILVIFQLTRYDKSLLTKNLKLWENTKLWQSTLFVLCVDKKERFYITELH